MATRAETAAAVKKIVADIRALDLETLELSDLELMTSEKRS